MHPLDVNRIEDRYECMLCTFSNISAVLLIVIEDSGIDSLSTGSVIIDGFPSVRTIRNEKIISGTVKRLHVSGLTIIGSPALFIIRAMIDLTKCQRTAILDPVSGFVIAERNHRETGITDRSTVSVKLFLLIRSGSLILINDRNHVILIKKRIEWKCIHSTVEECISWMQGWIHVHELSESGNCGQRIMLRSFDQGEE